MSKFQNGELLPQREILQYTFPTAAKKANEYSESEQEQAIHEPGLYQTALRSKAVGH